MENEIKFRDISKIEKLSTDFSRFGDEYIFARITPRTLPHISQQQGFRFKGLIMLLVKAGEVKVETNMQPQTLTAGSLLFTSQRTVIKLEDFDADTLDAYMLILSSDFMRNVSIDLNTMSAVSHPFKDPAAQRHSVMLTDEEFALMSSYFKLFHLNTTTNSNEMYVRSIARALASAVFYQLMHIGASRVEEPVKPRQMSRRMNYVHDFMELVHKHYRQQRSVGFYAEKLFISPKYLSLIVKEATGRSAADWIDDCVIIEAKNLLRFSGLNIQQVAYELNFNNQSSFGKYFKHLTGMSPTQFQQS